MNRDALDRHITGNYGEDQFRQSPKYPPQFFAGQKARKAGKPITACRCRTFKARQDWRAGWYDEDAAQHRGDE